MPALEAVIFDLDGVIVSTDEYHYRAWKRLADEEGIPFDRADNERLRGVSRMDSLAIVLEKANKVYTDQEWLALAERKNETYRASLSALSREDILPGVLDWLAELNRLGLKTAIGSSSKNAQTILHAIGLDDAFDTVVDGTHIQRSKPDPQVFMLAAERLGVEPARCLVVEDAESGVDAALAAGMRVLAVGSAASHPGATIGGRGLNAVSVGRVLELVHSARSPRITHPM